MIDENKFNVWKYLFNLKVISTLTVLLTGYSVYENYYDLHGIALVVYAIQSVFGFLLAVVGWLFLTGVVVSLAVLPFTNGYQNDLKKDLNKIKNFRNGEK